VSVRVREASVDEVEVLRSILAGAFEEYEGRLDPPSGVHAESAESLAGRMRHGGALVCEIDGEVAGCAFYAREAGFLYVGRVGVLPEFRGRGVGGWLLEAAERRARELGYERVRLNVRLALERLRAYYAARGYVPMALHSHAGYDEPTYVEMEKVLPALTPG
jgi:GNAT superfamily N-acetyltransferase